MFDFLKKKITNFTDKLKGSVQKEEKPQEEPKEETEEDFSELVIMSIDDESD